MNARLESRGMKQIYCLALHIMAMNEIIRGAASELQTWRNFCTLHNVRHSALLSAVAGQSTQCHAPALYDSASSSALWRHGLWEAAWSKTSFTIATLHSFAVNSTPLMAEWWTQFLDEIVQPADGYITRHPPAMPVLDFNHQDRSWCSIFRSLTH